MQRSDPRRFSENRAEKPANPALESIAAGMGFTGAASSGPYQMWASLIASGANSQHVSEFTIASGMSEATENTEIQRSSYNMCAVVGPRLCTACTKWSRRIGNAHLMKQLFCNENKSFIIKRNLYRQIVTSFK